MSSLRRSARDGAFTATEVALALVVVCAIVMMAVSGYRNVATTAQDRDAVDDLKAWGAEALTAARHQDVAPEDVPSDVVPEVVAARVVRWLSCARFEGVASSARSGPEAAEEVVAAASLVTEDGPVLRLVGSSESGAVVFVDLAYESAEVRASGPCDDAPSPAP